MTKKKKKMIMRATMEEPILSRLDRLDTILKQLEEMRGGVGNYNHSPKSSTASTPSTGTLTSSTDFSPRSLERHCRPIDDVVLEAESKGTLLDRLVQVEDRVFKLCLKLGEEQREAEKKKEDEYSIRTPPQKSSSRKGLKHFVESCVKGKTKDR